MRTEILEKLTSCNGKQVNFNSMDIDDAEIRAIIIKIKTLHPMIENIFLQNNKITDEGALTLASGLSGLSNLSFVDLQFNEIGKKGIAAVTALQAKLPELTLALHGNKIGNVGEIREIENQTRMTRKR